MPKIAEARARGKVATGKELKALFRGLMPKIAEARARGKVATGKELKADSGCSRSQPFPYLCSNWERIESSFGFGQGLR